MSRMTDMLEPELASLPAGPPRARAWLMLSDGVGPKTMEDVARYEDHALAECGTIQACAPRCSRRRRETPPVPP